MGCDIHLYLEERNKRYGGAWYSTSFRGKFSERFYEMFAALNNVRNYWDIKPMIPDRGIPDNICWETFEGYYRRVVPKEEKSEYTYSEEEAQLWVKQNNSNIIWKNGERYCSNPDAYAPNWCTTQELEKCYIKISSDYGCNREWLALINYMKTLEKDDVYEVRAVFWFDN